MSVSMKGLLNAVVVTIRQEIYVDFYQNLQREFKSFSQCLKNLATLLLNTVKLC